MDLEKNLKSYSKLVYTYIQENHKKDSYILTEKEIYDEYLLFTKKMLEINNTKWEKKKKKKLNRLLLLFKKKDHFRKPSLSDKLKLSELRQTSLNNFLDLSNSSKNTP